MKGGGCCHTHSKVLRTSNCALSEQCWGYIVPLTYPRTAAIPEQNHLGGAHDKD